MAAVPSDELPSDLLLASRQSCETARSHAKIGLSFSAIDSFLRTLDRAKFERLKGQHGLVFDDLEKFESVEAELDFLTMLALLNFLSAYRAPFHQTTGQGAYQNVVRLVTRFQLYRSSKSEASAEPGARLGGHGGGGSAGGREPFSARFMSAVPEEELVSIWGLPTDRHGLLVQELREPVDLVLACLHDTGKALSAAGHSSLGDVVLAALNAQTRAQEDPQTAGARGGDQTFVTEFIRHVVCALPGFNDSYVAPSGHILMFKKAYFLFLSLHQRLSALSQEGRVSLDKLRVPSASEVGLLPMFVDNVLPTMAVHLGFLELQGCRYSGLRDWAAHTAASQSPDVPTGTVTEGPALTHEEAYTVRAATLNAGQVIVARARTLARSDGGSLAWLTDLDEAALDGYLWSVAKDDAKLRKVPRMVERGTIMY